MDAHTLTLPIPLVQLAGAILKTIPALSTTELVVLHTSALMYYQTPYGSIRDTAIRLLTRIPEATFPTRFGVVALPYSQGSRLFTNLSLFHELGHVVYEAISIKEAPHLFSATIREQIRSSLTHHIPEFSEEPDDAQEFLIAILQSWSEEIFCDLFAVSVVGPSFSLSFLDLITLLGQYDTNIFRCFTPTHPAPAYRFKLQLELLKTNKWNFDDPSLSNPRLDSIGAIAAEPKSKYIAKLSSEDNLPNTILDAFFDVVPIIQNTLIELTLHCVVKGDNYPVVYRSVHECLERGIVPSIVAKHTAPDLALQVYVLNASYQFALISLSDLAQRIEHISNNSTWPTKLSFWSNRLEGWTLKALEDLFLLSSCRHTL